MKVSGFVLDPNNCHSKDKKYRFVCVPLKKKVILAWKYLFIWFITLSFKTLEPVIILHFLLIILFSTYAFNCTKGFLEFF